MSWENELYVVKLKALSGREYSKKMSLDEIKDYLEITAYNRTYNEYIKPGLLYFTEDLNALARELGVDGIVPMGLYVRGIYGGEKKKGEEEYAGLIVLEHGVEGATFRFRLYNTKDMLIVPVNYLKRYGVKVYRMIYVGEINPFRINRYLNIILSELGEAMLKKFLEEALELNERSISAETLNKVRKLIGELRHSSTVKSLSTERYYVVYRCDRAFTASVYIPCENSVVESHVSYVETRSEDVAYYYAAILNYLAHKVLRSGRTFNRHQFARPLLAIYMADFSWYVVDEETRGRIVELSKTLHEKAPSKEYSNQRVALRELAELPEFKELVKIVDSKVDRSKLEEALSLVSGLGTKKGEKEPEE
ncbi:hypothetical protein DDW10_04010 [Sulfolobales archaeon SCGC AB-777_J03]|nr:hypothetical protein DDW10_04010 [Sulfolobales archaeon SCGC AB-777_J03]